MGRFSLSRFPFLWEQRTSKQDDESRPLIQRKDTSAPPNLDTDDSTEGKTESSSSNHRERSRHPSWMFLSQSTRHHQPCGPSDCLLKYVLVTTNLLFWALGLCVLGLGLWGLLEKESLTQERLESLGTDPMLTLATSGLALTLLCLVGCAGALRENSCLMRTFCTALLAVLASQVLAIIVAYGLQDWITGVLRAAMLGAVARYQDDTDLRFIIDEIQVGLQCCGAENYQDWEINSYFNCTAPGMWACSVPPSCCVDPLENGSVWNSQCGAGARRLDELTAHRVVFLGGCLGAVSRWIEHHSGLIGTVAITLLALQILMLLFTASLLNRIQWNKVSLGHWTDQP
ncbi:tetraspanin-10 [Electrophorus electricus]|uniref:tetraspanin-10 n=1 Tax=Electrophorus electricus TaxID=8005 RepID=UPI0015D0BB55|nr:tetraspanin-10 [Electrophorus electricus]